MKYIYSGNIKSLSSLIDRINNENEVLFLHINKITHAELKKEKFEVSGYFCKGIGQIKKQKDNLEINLKVRLRKRITLTAIFIIVFLCNIIWGENVTINQDSDPDIWKRIEAAFVGLIIFLIPTLILLKFRSKFEKKIIKTIK